MTPDEIIACLSSLGIQNASLSRGGAGTEIVASCPFHEDRTPSFGVASNKDGHPCSCFAECFRGTIVTLAKQLLDISYREALEYVKKFGEIEAPADLKSITSSEKVDERFVHWAALAEFHYSSLQTAKKRDLRLIRSFLETRYLRPENLTKFCGWSSYDKRLTYSWVDSKNRIRGFSWRELVKPYRKQFDSGFRKTGECLFFPQIYENPKLLVVVEGPLDAISVHQHTSLPSCAIGHASPSDHQIQMICDRTDRVLLLLDSDDAGERGRQYAEKKLGDRVMILPAVNLTQKDASRTHPDSLRKALKWLLTYGATQVCSGYTLSVHGAKDVKRSPNGSKNGNSSTVSR